MGVLELVNCNKNQIILKVDANDPLTVAMNHGFSSKMAYITVTRGSNNILTVTNEDGTTWSFHCKVKKIILVWYGKINRFVTLA